MGTCSRVLMELFCYGEKLTRDRMAFIQSLSYFRVSDIYHSVRSLPQKNRATVPGPVWLPMVVPI